MLTDFYCWFGVFLNLQRLDMGIREINGLFSLTEKVVEEW